MPSEASVLAICGHSGSGKTTLILSLIEHLATDGIRVAVIKHDCHGLSIDREGKDSDRLFRAGADVVMRGPGELFFRSRPAARMSLEAVLAEIAPSYDLVLLEGHKDTPAVDKIWLMADGEDAAPDGIVRLLASLPRSADRLSAVLPIIRERLACRTTPPVYGGILVGGASRRMGSAKHTMKAGGLTYLERVADALAPCVERVVILGAKEIPTTLQHLPVMPDAPDREGPIAGMLSAMRWAPEASWIFMACDLPLMSQEAIRWILSQRQPGCLAVLPSDAAGHIEPLGAWYGPQAAALLALCRGPIELAGQAGVLTPPIPAALADAWRNVNTPAEAEAISGGM